MSLNDGIDRILNALPPVVVPEIAEVEPFRRWSVAEVMAVDRTFEWTVKGLMAAGTYGMWAGEKKSLKSYSAYFLALAVASGKPMFDRFSVPTPGPVVIYVGEGGVIPTAQRLERQARAMGIPSPEQLPIQFHFQTKPVMSPEFQETLRGDLEEMKPALVIVDPLYSFHGASVSSQNLHEEGELLNAMSGPCVEAGASLVVVNHFNKSGTGRGLERITMAGGGEWSDSWWLMSHREAPKVSSGEFKLLMEAGSRRWGGTEWELDLTLGSFDNDLGLHVGEIEWDLRAASESGNGNTRARIISAVIDEPLVLTKEELAKKVGGRLTDTRALIDILTDNVIKPQIVERKRADGRPHKVWVYGPASLEGRDGTTEEVEA